MPTGTVYRKLKALPLPTGAELFGKSRKSPAAERVEKPDFREVVEHGESSGKSPTAPSANR